MSDEFGGVDPKVGLGVTFESGGKSVTRVLATVKVPSSVRKGLQTVSKKVKKGAKAAGSAATGAAVTVAGKVKETSQEHAQKGLKTFGAVTQLRPQDIPKDYADALYKALRDGAANGPKDPTQPAGTTAYTDFGLLQKGLKAAGYFPFPDDAELGMVVYVDKDDNVSAVVGKITIPLK